MNEVSYSFAFFEGKIVPIEHAKISIMTNALQYGTAVFGGIRGYVADDKKAVYIFRIQEHYRRFLQSLAILNKTIPYTHSLLVEATLELARRNKPKTDCYIRPLAYAATLGLSPDLNKVDFDFLMYMLELGEYLPIHKGLRLGISNWVRVTDSIIPARAKLAGGYVNSALAKGDAAKLGYDDALMLSADGHITEASAANFFMVRDGVLITAPVYADILEGITRRSIMELAKDLGIPMEVRPIDRTEVFIADEAFLSGTGVQVAWIGEVDGRKIGSGTIGPITEKIQNLFFAIVRGNEKKYSNWLTKL